MVRLLSRCAAVAACCLPTGFAFEQGAWPPTEPPEADAVLTRQKPLWVRAGEAQAVWAQRFSDAQERKTKAAEQLLAEEKSSRNLQGAMKAQAVMAAGNALDKAMWAKDYCPSRALMDLRRAWTENGVVRGKISAWCRDKQNIPLYLEVGRPIVECLWKNYAFHLCTGLEVMGIGLVNVDDLKEIIPRVIKELNATHAAIEVVRGNFYGAVKFPTEAYTMNVTGRDRVDKELRQFVMKSEAFKEQVKNACAGLEGVLPNCTADVQEPLYCNAVGEALLTQDDIDPETIVKRVSYFFAEWDSQNLWALLVGKGRHEEMHKPVVQEQHKRDMYVDGIRVQTAGEEIGEDLEDAFGGTDYTITENYRGAMR